MHAGSERIWPLGLGEIERVVSAHLGPGRVPGNAAAPCFSRQVSMYLARHIGQWSLPQIGRFYDGRHHTTVLHAIGKIEKLRKVDGTIDALLDVLADELSSVPNVGETELPACSQSAIIELVAQRVIERLSTIDASQRPHGGACQQK